MSIIVRSVGIAYAASSAASTLKGGSIALRSGKIQRYVKSETAGYRCRSVVKGLLTPRYPKPSASSSSTK